MKTQILELIEDITKEISDVNPIGVGDFNVFETSSRNGRNQAYAKVIARLSQIIRENEVADATKATTIDNDY